MPSFTEPRALLLTLVGEAAPAEELPLPKPLDFRRLRPVRRMRLSLELTVVGETRGDMRGEAAGEVALGSDLPPALEARLPDDCDGDAQGASEPREVLSEVPKPSASGGGRACVRVPRGVPQPVPWYVDRKAWPH
mmetsp:Transcript_86173/g.157116  ORF Transcript_86173/g.157116 Transcript_86173/m.157116 type:complete len:135 (-) Transcript_86173:1239-1643(-)